jgi:hypothetical protein
MACIQGIAADLINDCAVAPVAGLEEIMYVFNADELTATKSLTVKSLVTDLAVLVGKKGYKVQGFKKSSNAKNELVVSDMLPDMYKQTIEFQVWAKDSATITALDQLNNLVIVTENKDKGTAGASAFNIYGLDTGLFKATMTQDVNTDAGVFKLSMVADGQRLPFYNYYNTSYALSKADLEALLITQV